MALQALVNSMSASSRKLGLERSHKSGMEFLARLRMNDRHSGSKNLLARGFEVLLRDSEPGRISEP